MVALVGVLVFGILKGVLLAVIASILMLLPPSPARTSRFSDAFQARGGLLTLIDILTTSHSGRAHLSS